MISTKGLELTNFINPDLTWKTVSKGYRSSTRRSRKQADRSPKSDADLPDKGTESPSDTTVSESEKLGVAVLGQRFSDKVEHVPIKKRRFTVRSLSPPRYCSPHKKDHEQFREDKQSCQKSTSKKPDGSTRRRKANQICNEDFSGIEILAAAACNNNMGDDINREDRLLVEKSSQDSRDKSIIGLPVEECISSKETTHSSQVDTVLEGAKGVFQNNADANHNGAEDYQKDTTDKKTVEKSVSLRDFRLHWDLNVEMDAWETPCDTDSHTNALEDGKDEKLQVQEACEFQESKDGAGVIAVPVQSIMDQEERRGESSSCAVQNEDKCIPTDNASEFFTSGILAEISQNAAGDAPYLVSESVKASVLSEGTVESSLVGLGVKEDNHAIGVALIGNEKFEGSACKIENTLLCVKSDLKLPKEMTSSHSSPPVVPARKAEEVGVSHTVPGCEGTLASVVPVSKVDVNAEEQVGAASMVHPIRSEEVHELAGNSRSNLVEVSQISGVATEDTKGDGHVLSASDKQPILEKGSSRDFDTGYDSQYEDGELRESDAPPYWEEVDSEECVDYGSDTCDDAAAFSTSNKFGMQVDCGEEEFYGRERSVDVQLERVFGSRFDGVCEHGAAVDSLRQKPVSSKMKTSGSEEFSRGSEISPTSRMAELSEGCMIRKHTNSLDSFDGKDSLTKVVGSVASGKELPGSEESLGSDTLHRNDSVLLQRSRSTNLDFCSLSDEARADHTVGKVRSDLQIHPKSPVGLANPSVSYWDSRRRESPTFRGSFGSDRSRPRSVVESRGGYAMHTEGGGADNYGHRQTMNSFSNGSYRYPVRRRSPANRDDTHNTHRGMLPMRDGSPDRRGFRRYPQGVGRGFRDYHQRPLPPNDSDEYSHVSNRIVRRDQNSPPPPNRGPVYYRRPYKRSSRSPGGWIASRDQHEAAKHRNSRSPEYRFEPRMQRMRLPFQKQNFGAKYEVGFISPQRRRFSPQQHMNNNINSRWFDDQNGGNDFRGRRIPARTFQQGQRFDSVGSSRRMNSDDYYEPAMRPARFSEMGRGRGGGSGGTRRYDGSDDERRRPDNSRYEMYPRVKRCDSDGLRRMRFDEDDSFVSRNSNNYNDSDNNNNNNNNNNSSGAERRPRNFYMGELVKRKAN